MNHLLPLAMDIAGSPFDTQLQMSDIALVLAVLLSLIKIYRKIDQFEQTFAERMGMRMDQKAKAKKVDIQQPLEVRETVKYVTEEDHRQTHGRITRERGEVDHRINGIEGRVEKLESKHENAMSALRLEIKGDIKGVHDRINAVLEAVSEMKGRLQ